MGIHDLLWRLAAAGSPQPLPPFLRRIEVPAILAAGSKLYRLSGDLRPYRLWSPFTIFSIQNLSAVNVTIEFNYSSSSAIECASSGFQVRKNQPFCNFNIINQSAATGILINEITVWIERIP